MANSDVLLLKKSNFIVEAIKIHGSKYDYSKSEYINAKEKVIIICRKHGEFQQIPRRHLAGSGCTQCSIQSTVDKQRLSIDEFIARAREAHGDKFIYDKVSFVRATDKITIVCKEHGEFDQRVMSHINGFGCKQCNKNGKKSEMMASTITDTSNFHR